MTIIYFVTTSRTALTWAMGYHRSPYAASSAAVGLLHALAALVPVLRAGVFGPFCWRAQKRAKSAKKTR